MTISKSSKGFTLLEFAIAIAIISILCATATITYSSWIPKLKFNSTGRSLFLDFQFAKKEAIKRNADVAITINKVDCTLTLPEAVPQPGGSYSIFVDDGSGGGNAGNGKRDGDEPILVTASMPPHIAICKNSFAATPGFNSASLPLSKGAIALNNDSGYSSELSVSFAGNISIK